MNNIHLHKTFVFILNHTSCFFFHRPYTPPQAELSSHCLSVINTNLKKKCVLNWWIQSIEVVGLVVFFCSPFYSTWNWVDSWNWNAEIHNNIEYGQFCWKSILNWVIINVNKFDTFRFNQMSIFRSYQINRINLRSVSLSVGIHIVKVAFQSINRFIHTHSGTDAFSTNKIHYIKF